MFDEIFYRWSLKKAEKDRELLKKLRFPFNIIESNSISNQEKRDVLKRWYLWSLDAFANSTSRERRKAKKLAELYLEKYFKSICPETGSFYGYKKAWRCKNFSDKEEYSEAIVTLKIPENALRTNGFDRKCRCDKAIVVGITAVKLKKGTDRDQYVTTGNVSMARSDHDPHFYYCIGQEVKVRNFNKNRWETCSRGIHFFLTREEAERYCIY